MTRLERIERKVRVLLWMVVVNLALTLVLLVKVFWLLGKV
jgi:hypothetical protein